MRGRARQRGRRWPAAVALGVLGAFLATACGESDLLRTHARPSVTVPPTTAPPTTAPPTTVPPTTGPPTTASPRRVALAFTGDTMAHDAVVRSARRNGEAAGTPYDFGPMWQQVQPILSAADLAVCHLETTITTTGAPPTGFPRFRAPIELASALRNAGYDACTTASNHSYDHGVDGVVQTIDALEQAGLRWAGTARNGDEAASSTIFTAAGVRVALLSATYGLNGLRLPDDKPWLVDTIDVPRLLDEAAAARAAGADVVVASLHCCAEYRVEPTPAQADNARQLLASPDIDLVVGHHAHVVQPIERIGDEWAIHGLGNIVSNMYGSSCCPPASQDGVIVEVDFEERADRRFTATRVEFTPTWVDRDRGHVITVVTAALADPGLAPDRRAELEASFWRTVTAVGSRGAIDAGAALAGTSG